MKPLQIGLFVVAGGFGGALVMNWQSRHYRTTVGMAVRMPAPMRKSPVLPPVPFLESYDPPVPEPESPTPEPESPTKVVPSWRPPRLAPARQPIRVHHSIKQPFAKPSYNRIPMPDPTHYGHSAFVFPVPNSGCRPMKAVESETIQAIVHLEVGLVAVVEALRDWTTAFPSAGGVRPSPPATSSGLAVWQRGPRDAFGRLQTY